MNYESSINEWSLIKKWVKFKLSNKKFKFKLWKKFLHNQSFLKRKTLAQSFCQQSFLFLFFSDINDQLWAFLFFLLLKQSGMIK